MLATVVHKTTRRSGRVSTRDELLDVERLTIGRGTDNDIQLSGLAIELHHSALRKLPDGIYIKTVEATELEINGRRHQERKLEVGDKIRIGNFRLTVLARERDEDIRLELESIKRRRSDREELAERTEIGLARGLFTERKLSWACVVLIPFVFAGIPILTGSDHDPGRLEPFWDTGPMARAHSFFATECKECHALPFRRVRDDQCLACHADINAHTPPDVQVIDLETTRCGNCHMEHNGQLGLAALEQELCAECHSDLAVYAPKTEVKEVDDFGENHPEFRLTVPTESRIRKVLAKTPTAPEREVWVREVKRIEIKDGIEEHSGVLFNHARHVAQEEVKGENGRLLDCGDCHQMDAAGKNMKDINFEEHCQSCHSIGFDERFPDRQAIHGAPAEMREDILEFYTAIELKAVEKRVEVLRQRFGEARAQEARQVAMDEAMKAVRQADAFLMDEEKPGACANCHTIEKGEAEDGGDDVAPVKLLNLWMPKSIFAHQTHEPFPCRDCHPAAAVYDPLAVDEEDRVARPRPKWTLGGLYALYTPEELEAEHGLEPSTKATDVLIPRIERCQTCHAGADAPEPMVASDCVLCHPFHRKEFDRMRPVDTLPTATIRDPLDERFEIPFSSGAG